VLLRLLNMRGVDLELFQFDYDLTWAAFFMSAEGQIYGRFGGRDAESPDKYLTPAGLKHAMRAALASHRESRSGPARQTGPTRTAEQFPAARKLKADACIHCHQVYDFRREELQDNGKWSKDQVWVYPLPENIGLAVDPDQGDKVQAVVADSPAKKVGLQPGDRLTRLNGLPVTSFADVQHALHEAPRRGRIGVAWERAGKPHDAELELADGWRKTDISWRASMWGLAPQACVWGQDLSAAEKRELGLSEKRLAFRQGNFVPAPARQAGIRQNDIILGIDGKELEMTMLQFNAYVRLNLNVGDRVTFNIIRDGKRLEVPMTLPAKAPF
jgi:serine protease Do